ncbi:MAG TPA: DNA ligase D [Polyangiaceae bacterium]|nr:DNA ligase D [Polyangiaceae bacterium]
MPKPPPSKQPASGVSAASSDALAEYRHKRNPLSTNEPFAAERQRRTGATRNGRFVVHLHSARNRHYDLRMQVGRRLVSFPVPRGPSLDPREKRLAIQTEDHPLEYADFEEIIPEGNYGAGPMIAWDIGRVSYLETTAEEGLVAGKLDFVLYGHKLRGRFALVRTKRGAGNEWLLIKKPDAYSREEGDILEDSPESVLSGLTVDELALRDAIAAETAARARQAGAVDRQLAASFEPMLCSDEGGRIDDPERLYELKLDGVRIVARKSGRKVSLTYRNGGVCTHNYPEVARALETIPGNEVVLDGEIIAFDEHGRPRFQRLGPRIQARTALDVARVAAETPVVMLVFDLLALDGLDLTQLPLVTRKSLMKELVRGKGLVRALDHFEGRGAELFELCKAQGLEGVVGKQRNSVYRFGPRRGLEWVKFKCEREDDFVVIGYIPGKGTRGKIGALGLGTYRDGVLTYRGRVGTGFDGKMLDFFAKEIGARETKERTIPAELPEDSRQMRWVRPELVVNVRYQGYTDDARLRFPIFQGVRADIAPSSCLAGPHDEANGPLVFEAPEQKAATPERAQAVVKLSNRGKVFWPEQGYTKGDLLDYYASVAHVMLPFLEERPVVLVRYPDGIHGKNFYQWNVPQGTPEWLRVLVLQDPEEPDKQKHVFLLDSVEALLHVINLGCIPLHVLASRAGTPELCDFITFDFDLGSQPFARAIELALRLKNVLEDTGLVGFPKTSGQEGLHVLVPLGPGVPFTAAKLMVELLGRIVVSTNESFSTMERRVDKRGGRLYVDTGQTGTSRTIVAPYSVRANAIAGVSTPLFWDELSGALDVQRFNLMTVPARIEELGDPWSALLEARPDIPGALAKLEKWLR